jgi:tetratricopeptide (TPR) repeat protein
MIKRVLLVTALAGVVAFSAWGVVRGQDSGGGSGIDGLMGAKRVMSELSLGGEAVVEEKGLVEVPQEGVWEKDVKLLARKVDGLAPGEAAHRWVELYDRMMALSKEEVEAGTHGRMGFKTLCMALPRPEAWGQVEALARKREIKAGHAGLSDLVLLLLAQGLVNDRAGQEATLHLLEAVGNKDKAKGEPGRSDPLRDGIIAVRQVWGNGGGRDGVTVFEEAMKGDVTWGSVEVPDLTGPPDLGRARGVLLEAIKGFKTISTSGSGEATRKLAVEVAMANLDQMEKPQWGLVSGVEGVELFEAMRTKFVKSQEKPGEDPAERWIRAYGGSKRDLLSAVGFYLAGLVARGDGERALAFIKAHPAQVESPWKRDSFWGVDAYDAVERGRGLMEKTVSVEQAFDFLDGLTTACPEYRVWRRFWAAGNRAGKPGVVVKKLRSVLSDAKLTALDRGILEMQLAEILLDEGQVQEGVELTLKTAFAPGMVGEGQKEQGKTDYDALGRALKCALLAGDPALQERAEKVVWATLEKAPVKDSTDKLLSGLVGYWLEKKRPVEAEMRIKTLLARYCQGMKEDKGNYGGWETNGSRARSSQAVELLALVYHQAGRHADVVALMDGAPVWGQGDLGAYVKWALLGDEHPTLPVVGAAALARTGRTKEARQVVYGVLEALPGCDEAYALLLEIDGERAAEKLDAVFARERYEERPLIWKARLCLNQRKLDEAERLARAAIAMDPMDANPFPGARMLAYGVLRETLLAKGDATQAQRLEAVLKSVRKAQEGDAFRRAGLTGKAIGLYGESIALWDGAWWPRGRLHDALKEIGRGKEGEVHYRRGIELMREGLRRGEDYPESLMRMALLFNRDEEVIDAMSVEMTRKGAGDVKALYVVGFLRMMQWRRKEALAFFKESTRQDKDFLCAWRDGGMLADLEDADEGVFIQAAAENILRLDQTGRYAQMDLKKVRDLRALWGVLEAYPRDEVERAKALYPLKQRRKVMRAGNEPEDDSVRSWMARKTALEEVNKLVEGVRGY